ncbi:conserved exported hypothetical protein [Gammaproteobacteria bacterium]
MKFLITIILLILCSTTLALDNQPIQCPQFNGVALQFALAQTNMQSPFSLEQLQNALGQSKPESTAVTATYTWTYKSRILLVSASNSDLTKKMLTGNDDGSLTSKQMEQAYEKLKTATSIWTIKEIERQLGPGRITRTKSQNYSWHCGIGSLEITTDQDNNITAASISYKTSQNKNIIEAQLGFNHPTWDIATDSFSGSYRAWKRSF